MAKLESKGSGDASAAVVLIAVLTAAVARAIVAGMPDRTSGKRIARLRTTLTKRSIEWLRPRAKPWIAWDDRLTGFGIRIQPSGMKAFLVNYRTGNGGRTARNRRLVLGRYGPLTPGHARRLAQQILGRVAAGEDPAEMRAAARAVPTLRSAFEDYLAANPGLKASTRSLYSSQMRYCLGDWLSRPLDSITRQDVEARFHQITDRHGWATGNHAISLLRSVFRRPVVDHPQIRNPVDLWLAGGGRYNPPVRRKIPDPAELLPRWCAAIESEVRVPSTRNIFWIGLYTGMRRGEVTSLHWDRVDLDERVFRVEETKTGALVELPITRQLATVLAGQRIETRRARAAGNRWVFPSPRSPTGHVIELQHLHRPISRTAGARFWFHGLRNAFITVAERDLMLPRALTKRLVNHSQPRDVTERYAADWTVRQLREPAQRVADRIAALARPGKGASSGS